MRTPTGWLMMGVAVVLASGATANAYFLDKGRHFDVRLRAYTQLGIMADSSEEDWGPGKYSAGDLAQHRNFYNPEFDAKLTDYTRWMGNVPGLSLVAPDDFKFRFAWWGFYDGLYDYLNGPWNSNRRKLRARFSQSDDPYKESYVFKDENKNPRHIYASRNRINEMYLDYTTGRFFFRLGRQGISWGESDTIALLDATNNFDLTQGAPGFFQDVDEARIPFWALRSTVKLVDNWRWLSSFFLDTYLVPGPIDTTVPINPITGGVTPFGPDVGDPQTQVDEANASNLVRAGLCSDPKLAPDYCRLQIATVDRLPENTWANTRWGARLTGVLFRDYTVQGWFFRTFNQAPTPLLTSPGPLSRYRLGLKPTYVNSRGARCRSGEPGCELALPVVTILERRLESVVGVAATWFSPMVNGIIRTEAEYFIDELAFIPSQNLNARGELPKKLLPKPFPPINPDPDPITGKKFVSNSIPTANYLRFMLGYDRFFFFRLLNPSNSFIISTAFNGSINMSERRGQDFRNPNPKPGKPAATVRAFGGQFCKPPVPTDPALGQLCVVTPPENFEDAYKFEGFLTTALQTDYLHGRLQPRLVFINDVSGIFGFAPTATYRFSDSFLGTVTFLAIEGSRRAGLATFRGHDMVQLRLTYQLN